MGSINLVDLMGAYSALDFGIDRGGHRDVSAAINAALLTIAATDPANGTLFFPPGTYRIGSTISQPSNIEVVGAGSSTLFQLIADANVNVWSSSGTSNIRLRNLRIDGNRANESGSGFGNGLLLSNVTDGWLENVEIVSADGDGVHMFQCTRVEMRGVRASDNGRHGFSMDTCDFCILAFVRAFDNSRVAASGTGDGINLDILSHDNLIAFPLTYESALTGGRQGYGVREASGGGCYRNMVIASPQANATADFLVEPDSLAMSYLGLLGGGNFGIGTTSPNSKALLDLTSTQKGLLLPRLTTAQRGGIASPPAGLMIYNSTTNKLNFYSGSAWEAVTSA